MSKHDIIVVGASAGGVEALNQLVGNLPPDLSAAIFVVLHVPAQGTSFLPNILNRTIRKHDPGASLQAVHPKDGDVIQHGRIYVAPPDRHLLVKDGYIRLARGPKENNHRPAIDPLFRTAARTYARRVVGVILSGTLDDGTAGLAAVKQLGGVAIVQNPEDALYSGMPRSAIENVEVDHILPVSEMTPILVDLTHQPVEQEGEEAVPSDMEIESDIAELELGAMQKNDRPGTPSPFACPECSGTLWEINEGKLVRFRCRTGHAFSVDSLLAAQSENLEQALWSALRALEEKGSLASRLANRARDRNQPYSAKHFEQQEQDVKQSATLVRQLLLNGEGNQQDKGQRTKDKGQRSRDKEAISEVVSSAISGASKSSLPTPDSRLPTPDSRLQVVAICSSAGGLKALSEVLSNLPADFPAAIAVVQHLHRQHPSLIAEILNRRTPLQVEEAKPGDVLHPGKVYVAPPDRHLLVNPDGILSLSDSELVHFVRPSADLLFESVAASFKERALAVVLTGTGSDGSMGVRAIKKMGGRVIAQDRATSEFFSMPKAAFDTGSVDFVVPLKDIAPTLENLVSLTLSTDQSGGAD